MIKSRSDSDDYVLTEADLALIHFFAGFQAEEIDLSDLYIDDED